MMFPKSTAQPDTRKACRNCGNPFHPRSSMHSVCHPSCLLRKIATVAKAERETTARRRDALKRIPDLIREAQTAFNAYIRARDAGQPCICCGQPLSAGDVGGKYDCGHYRSTGSASHLRFNEDNAHAQRKQCNRWGAGRAVDYRLGLIARIGLPRVEALESNNAVHKWTAEELRAIKAQYKAALKDINKTKEGK